MAQSTSSETPYKTADLSKLQPSESPLNPSTPYATGVSCLRYLADSTRPDIAFVTGLLGRYSHQPSPRHWKALKYVLRYLYKTKSFGITYSKTFKLLAGFSDADFAACPDKRRSTSGFVALWKGGPVAWQSKRQKFISASTWEAEYVAAYHAAKNVQCLQILLSDITDFDLSDPTPLHIDNSGAIKTAKFDHPTSNSKHIDVKYHHLKEQMERKRVVPKKIPSKENPADCL